ncbi:QLQ [Musa troglodytarum]|uniref:Growth-regulating factor n=1 Tax=Musa troglodytarum TaxID=320322 RepID=A0A9E7H1N2_9LILI|nr:QLQ [Musa troglodytarum]
MIKGRIYLSDSDCDRPSAAVLAYQRVVLSSASAFVTPTGDIRPDTRQTTLLAWQTHAPSSPKNPEMVCGRSRTVFPMSGERRSQPLQREEEGGGSTPRKLARVLSDEAGIVTMAAPSPLMLGLGLGLGRGVGASKPVFTFMQLQELEHQALIYKYMAAGLPVPVQLVLPIWKSVAASSFDHYSYPSCCSDGLRSLCLDYRNIMVPVPGRCRRSDGKKWRCSRDVVPNQKYCERHMHRGRNRPRKPVEAGATTSITATSTQLSITVPAVGRQLTADANTGISGGSRVSPPGQRLSHARVLQNDAAEGRHRRHEASPQLVGSGG